MHPKPARLLPDDAIAELVKASQTEPTRADPLARQKAIEKATERIKTRYPHLFHERTQA